MALNGFADEARFSFIRSDALTFLKTLHRPRRKKMGHHRFGPADFFQFEKPAPYST